jgi:hypothetical protein
LLTQSNRLTFQCTKGIKIQILREESLNNLAVAKRQKGLDNNKEVEESILVLEVVRLLEEFAQLSQVGIL